MWSLFLYKKIFFLIKNFLTICRCTAKFYFKDNGIFTSCFVWGSVGCRRWEKRAPSCHSPTKPLKVMTASISTQCHFLKVMFLKGGLQIVAASQNCGCFSGCGRCYLHADAAPSVGTSLTLNCFRYFIPNNRVFHKKKEALFLISWSGWNGQSWSKNDYEGGKWRPSECPSHPVLQDSDVLWVMLWKGMHKWGGGGNEYKGKNRQDLKDAAFSAPTRYYAGKSLCVRTRFVSQFYSSTVYIF